MAARIRVGVIGLTHDHIWSNLENLGKIDGAEIVAAAEPDAALRERFAARYGKPTFDDYDAILDKKHDLQAVFVFGDNRESAAWAARACTLGLHAMIEKPMAADLAGADELSAAGARHGTHVMVNWPHNWNAKLRHAYRLTSDGAIGDVFKLRYSGGHAGPREIGCSPIFCDWLYDADRNGVGALVDQGGYSATVCRWFLGRPSRVMAMGGRLTKEADSDLDNAVILLRYPNAIAVAETSWSWVGGLPTAGPVVYGVEGTLVAHGARDAAGVTMIKRGEKEPTIVEAPPLLEGERNAPEYFISRIREGKPIEGLVSARVSRDAQEILEAAAESIATGQEVSFPLDGHLPGI
ncbi:MAG: Gfo/Idh/MocA family oxidoreductase [Chloroflexota bacterium]|nr:MAG: Gfo/Idh/MocA family oxidoreductase [Chloroflexota bacterium]